MKNASVRGLGVGAGVFLMSLAITGLSVVLSRLHSALFGSAFSVVPVSLPILGSALGLGLAAFSIKGRRVSASKASTFAGLGTITSVFAVIQAIRTKLGEADPSTQWRDFLVLLALTVPVFILKGLVVAVVVRGPTRTVLVADALGAAFGGLFGAMLLAFGAPRAGLVLAIVFGASSVMFALAASRDPALSVHERRAVSFRGAAFLLAGVMLLWGDYGERWLELPKARAVNIERAVFSRWTSRGLLTVDKPSSAGYSMLGWDGNAKTAVHGPKTAPRLPEHAVYTALDTNAPVLVLGAGSVRDVRAALVAGRTSVVAVEPDRTLADDVLNGLLSAQIDSIFQRPEVELVRADPRVFVRTSERAFGVIVLPGVDANAGPNVRGLQVEESLLYTSDAFASYLGALEPNGYLVLRRWDPDLGRLLALAAEVLGPNAKQHLYACSHTGSTALFVKRTPITETDLPRLRDGCSPRFLEVFSPDTERDPGHEARVARPSEPDAISKLTPATDDLATFFVRTSAAEAFGRLHAPLALKQSSLEGGLVPLLVYGSLFALVLACAARASRWVREGTWGAPLAPWGLVGGAMAFVELVLIATVTPSLGSPSFALTFVLPVLFGASALGLLRSARGVAARVALALSMGIAALALLWPSFATATGSLHGVTRALLALLLLGAVGFARGALTGRMLTESENQDERGVRFWLATEASVAAIAIALGSVVQPYLGQSPVLFIGALLLFLAGALLILSRRRTTFDR